MKNKKGFTLVELMIVIGIAAILAVISIPSVMKWYKKDQFIQQTREIIDMINDARTNAITEKKCSDGNSSNYWIFSMSDTSFSLKCNTSIQDVATEFNKSTAFEFASIKINNNSFYETSVNSPGSFGTLGQKNINIKFMNASGQAKIFFDNIDDFSIRETRLQFYFSMEDSFISNPGNTSYTDSSKRTICFNRIAGFPTMSLTEECDD